jgi:hypothetical protein
MDQQPTCSLCGLQVMVEGDELSLDIGGHCIGCMIQVEAMSGHEPSKRQVEQEIAKGWRSSDGTRIAAKSRANKA